MNCKRFIIMVFSLLIIVAGCGENGNNNIISNNTSNSNNTNNVNIINNNDNNPDNSNNYNNNEYILNLNFQDLLEEALEDNNGRGGGVMRISSFNGNLLWEGASGKAIRNSQLEMSAIDTFEIASTSKTFTAVLILQLVEEGFFTLDSKIAELLTGELTTNLLVIQGVDYSTDITVRQLLNHTSGLPDYWYDPPFVSGEFNAFVQDYNEDEDRFWNPVELIGYAKQLNPIDVPGRIHHYSDTGYVLLGLLIEFATGKELHEVYKERFYEPLGMMDTYLSYREDAIWTGTHSHRYEDRWDMTDKVHNSADWAGGGLISSTRDLTLFISALAKGDLFQNENTQNQLLTWIDTGVSEVWYGLGVYRASLSLNRGDVWGHDGYGNSWMYYWPSKELLFVGTLNQTETDWWPLLEAAVKRITDEQP